ncbi:recombination-associated protein RdgC [Ideonella livida]|uniref:Recombination-associated protein RdgC n=1 Tax=Ideonella livida TaxID=2707176 RepID=A0A7C9PEP7_9BURK|nr:recombination-associated protein RdgC [Ideonella livida]NDY89768.1 recombination-associated protein RdgC [Ideonella livida]
MIKSAIIFALAAENGFDLDRDSAAIAPQAFLPCGPSQAQSIGWVPPRGEKHGPLIESVNSQWILRVRIETKVLPASVVKARTAELAAEMERNTGRTPGKKALRELKEQAIQELMPQAFVRQRGCLVWIDPKASRMVIDASPAVCEDIIGLLVKAWPGVTVQNLQPHTPPSLVMAGWLQHGPQTPFALGRSCTLKAHEATRAMVRYARHALDIDEVREHLEQGKYVTSLELSWHGRVGFKLQDNFHFKGIDFADVVYEQKSQDVDHFDADVAITTGELSMLIDDLVDAMGGPLQA